MPVPLTRFAPSPTGYLHLGHVVNALWVWGVARARGGRVLLRIEDHDRLRCRPEYEQAIFDDLDWLGFEPDVGPVRQSEAGDAYDVALQRLAAQDHVYACDCSRRTLAATTVRQDTDEPERAGEEEAAHAEIRYDGRCRARRLEPSPGRGLRLEMAPGIERFDDEQCGPQAQDPAAQCGDLLVRDRLGQWTYQFAVAVDDLRQRVDLVIRGADLLASTGRQMRVARLLGREQPAVFLHHPLVRDASGVKLSKVRGDTGVRELRAAGVAVDEVLGRAAAASGLVAPGTRLRACDAATLFG